MIFHHDLVILWNNRWIIIYFCRHVWMIQLCYIRIIHRGMLLVHSDCLVLWRRNRGRVAILLGCWGMWWCSILWLGWVLRLILVLSVWCCRLSSRRMLRMLMRRVWIGYCWVLTCWCVGVLLEGLSCDVSVSVLLWHVTVTSFVRAKRMQFMPGAEFLFDRKIRSVRCRRNR